MQIFEQERQDGLENIIQASASISYASIAEPCVLSNISKVNKLKSLASLDDSDLYYVQSILVTSSWNKNDDIFDKAEVWLARNTPEDKPTNLEHDESLIIGHITGNWPITEDGILIKEIENLEDLPEKYHILTGSVIYRAFTSPELKNRAEKLIAEIESGTKFVSMECFFKGFDYGLMDKSTGIYKTLARNENTAYLTKYLRSYGGLGEHENYKIGRVLRNITFSGKGFVEKPANPDSIIFNKNTLDRIFAKKSSDLIIAGVSNNQLTSNVENNIMSLEKEVAETVEVTTPVVETPETVETTETAPETAPEVSATTVVSNSAELENTIKIKDETIAALDATIVDLKSQLDTIAKKMKKDEESEKEETKTLKSALDAANETIAAYKNKEEEMLKKEKKMKRKASLTSLGFDEETSEAALEKFSDLSDTAFEAMTQLFAAKKTEPKKTEEKTDEETMMEKKKASETIVDSSALEDVEVADVGNLSVGDDAQASVNSTRAELIEFVCARLGKKLNKGE